MPRTWIPEAFANQQRTGLARLVLSAKRFSHARPMSERSGCGRAYPLFSRVEDVAKAHDLSALMRATAGMPLKHLLLRGAFELELPSLWKVYIAGEVRTGRE